ncbi:geranylgeranyl reductase family protein [Corynebacterium uropygiale]|uniref:Geranylgeranyl reductase family protein n=1 Tax=Corynebacterium uropygiale TaxID=1775911 RepID=A0A9X1QQS4_9CORY|nr:geranylgeranyl reductase family protein [Corynebacterium uropygiale]MCF4005849.1 geranylgeranyl reductase family protein [Corynebacterium uropygiale]
MSAVTQQLKHIDVLVIGAGPTGSTAALHAAQQGYSVLLCDSATFPRDKTCGDGLTPRALRQLRELGLDAHLLPSYRNKGLKLHGFGGSVTASWPEGRFGSEGSAMARRDFDHALLREAHARGSEWAPGAPAQDVELDGGRIREVRVGNTRVRPAVTLVCDGVRSTVGKALGRTWHREEVYGIAARSYCATPRAGEPWIHSHLELRTEDGELQPGYGWIFPLGGEDGHANVGCGALSTLARPAKVNTKKLLEFYASQQRAEWEFGAPEHVSSALLPMGGAVSRVAGPNWMLLGDAAALVNPLNGEGIDYGMESAELALSLLAESAPAGRMRAESLDLSEAWPATLRETFGEAFLLARTLARALTHPRFLPITGPLALRGPIGAAIMPAAARLMGNLITEEDKDLVARLWRASGRGLRGWEELRRRLGREEQPLWG